MKRVSSLRRGSAISWGLVGVCVVGVGKCNQENPLLFSPSLLSFPPSFPLPTYPKKPCDGGSEIMDGKSFEITCRISFQFLEERRKGKEEIRKEKKINRQINKLK